MSAVDAPPGLSFAGPSAVEFGAPDRARKLASRTFWSVLVLGGLTAFLGSRRLYVPGIELVLVGPMATFAVATVGLAVRSARLRVDQDGVRWGWKVGGFRMSRERLREAIVYTNAVCFTSVRGSRWCLARRDWDGFARIPAALAAAGIEAERRNRRGPLRAALQSYGAALDVILVANSLAGGGLLVLAATY